MIRVENLVKRYGRFKAVDQLSFQVARGEAVALAGPNGAGKTTVIRCLLGLLRCRGTLHVAGVDVRRRGRMARRNIGYVPQELAFYDDMRVREALAYFASLKRVKRSVVPGLVERTGLTGHDRKRVGELSGGLKQRLALASAMLADPPLLFLDEPTSNLDAAAQQDFLQLLAELKRDGKTVLFTSHRFEEIDQIADRVILLENGRLKRIVAPSEARELHVSRCVLRVLVSDIEGAVHALAQSGYEAKRNGKSVSVLVHSERKAAPICVLSRADIRVHDFEVHACADETGGGS